MSISPLNKFLKAAKELDRGGSEALIKILEDGWGLYFLNKKLPEIELDGVAAKKVMGMHRMSMTEVNANINPEHTLDELLKDYSTTMLISPLDKFLKAAAKLDHDDVEVLFKDSEEGGWFLYFLKRKLPEIKWDNTPSALNMRSLSDMVKVNACRDFKYGLNNLLKEYASSGNLDMIMYLVSVDKKLVAYYNYGLVSACINGHLHIVKYFMSLDEKYGIDPATWSDIPSACTLYASSNGHLNVVKYLMWLPKKYRINIADDDNYALRMASLYGHFHVVKYLISLDKTYGIDPTADKNGAIRCASQGGHLNIVKYLMSLPGSYGIDPTYKKNYAILFACHGGHLDVVEYLMTLDGVNPADNNNKAIGYACSKGHLRIVQYLMSLDKSYGIDPAANDNYAIRWASDGGHYDVVHYLMSLDKSYGIDPAANDDFALRYAIKCKKYSVAVYLLCLDKSYGINKDNKTIQSLISKGGIFYGSGDILKLRELKYACMREGRDAKCMGVPIYNLFDCVD